MTTYYGFCNVIDEKRVSIVQGELSRIEFEHFAIAECRSIVELIDVTYRLLDSSLSSDEKTTLARLANVILFEFVIDEGGALSWLREACMHRTSRSVQSAVAEVEAVLNEMVAISEWDGSVDSERYSSFGDRIAIASEMLDHMEHRR